MTTVRKCSLVTCPNIEEKYGKYKVCSRCKISNYCSKECQIADWKEHKKYCYADNVIEKFRNFLDQKRTSGFNEKTKNKKRIEVIAIWAREFFRCNANKKTPQFIVVHIDRKSLIADFSIEPDVIKEAKSHLTEDEIQFIESQMDVMLQILIIDSNSKAYYDISIAKVTTFESNVGVVAPNLIEL